MKLPYPPPFQDMATLADQLCVDCQTIMDWLAEGLLPPPLQVGGKQLWNWQSVVYFMEASTFSIASRQREIFGAPVVLKRKRVKTGIYVVSFSTFIKIGWSRNIERRLSGLELGLPGAVKLLATFEGKIDVERFYLLKFTKYKTRGEWFRYEGALAEWIKRGCPTIHELEA